MLKNKKKAIKESIHHCRRPLHCNNCTFKKVSTESPGNAMSRSVGGTEHSWCKAVPGGTGITVLAMLFSKSPNLLHLETCLEKLRNYHPILRAKLRFESSTNTFSFFTTSSSLIIENKLAQSFYLALENEMNTNPWSNQDPTSESDTDVMFASVYGLPEDQCAVVLRLHTAACDRAAAAFLLRGLLALLGEGEGAAEKEIVKEEGLGLAIEDCIPAGKANKPLWARGVDMLGYSVNSFRFSNLEFKEIGLPNSTEFVRLKIGSDDTDRILSGCKSRGIKLFGLLAAAGFIAARASKDLPDEKWEKYSLATLMDCRSLLDPVLSDHHVGFYHSAILNSHDVKGTENLWDLAVRIYTSFTNAKNNNKHFTDMADLNFLMIKAIENPSLTPSSSLRTSLFSVFEDTMIDHTTQVHKNIGVVDYIGCSSVHGVSPSLAIFDTIRDGELDCACVYPSPTHSRDQMQDLVDRIKKILVEASVC